LSMFVQLTNETYLCFRQQCLTAIGKYRVRHSPNTMITMVHGQAFHIRTWKSPVERVFSIWHPVIHWAALWVYIL